jgi:conserved repeat domain
VPDPIISGVVKDSSNKGLSGVTIKVIQNNTQVAETSTGSDGTYSLNFADSHTTYTVIASKLGYMPSSKTTTVAHSSSSTDTNFYGTANFKLYPLLKYSGSASSYVLNVGALPQILLDVYAGKSSAWVNSTSSSYSRGEGTPLEVKLLTASLLSGLLDVYSTGNDGYKTGGLIPTTNSGLNKILNGLGLNVGLLSATSNSSANPPQAGGSSEIASVNLNIALLKALNILSVNAGVISSNSSVTPNFNTGVLVSKSSTGVTNITVTLLGSKLLEIQALQTSATASVNGKPGGASANFTWKVASIKLLGANVDIDDLRAGVTIPGILTLSLGGQETNTSADGTYAKASGDALKLQILGLLGGGLVNLGIGHAEATAQVPVGGLHVTTSDLKITKTADNTKPKYLQNVTFTLKVHNNGPDAATGVTVTDKLPAGLKYISSNGKYNSNTGVWTIGNLASGSDAVLKITAQVIASNTQITNIASVTENNCDPDQSNDQSNTTINVGAASDLGITKTVDNKNPKYLQKVTFTLTAHNYGPDNATGVTVTDKLPTGLKYISSSGNYNPTTGVWTIGNLASGSDAVLTIVAQATSPNTKVTNTATTSETNYDPKSSNDKATAIVNIGPAADLAVGISVNNTHPKYLQKVTFTITASNYGPMDAKSVTVTLKMPAGFKYVSKDPNVKYDSKTGVWTIGNLKSGSKVVLHVVEQAVVSNVKLTAIASIKGTAITK